MYAANLAMSFRDRPATCSCSSTRSNEHRLRAK
ncbi:Uncharacterised protein [Mycobacterium tuberculosis]|nr:Uncharacterised protein [Mycobacterium tuberculosis]